ncbi:hypothetical protein V2A60_008047 [Cordyceps javanica]
MSAKTTTVKSQRHDFEQITPCSDARNVPVTPGFELESRGLHGKPDTETAGQDHSGWKPSVHGDVISATFTVPHILYEKGRLEWCDDDGSNPCAACRDRDLDCVYVFSRRVSKADLREELARLQSASFDDKTLLDSISSKETPPAQLDSTLNQLLDGQSRLRHDALLITVTIFCLSVILRHEIWVLALTILSCPSLRTPPGWRLLQPTTATATPPSTLMEGLSSQPSAGPSTNSPSTSHATSDDSAKAAGFRANLGYYRSQLLQLLSIILARGCLSFRPVSECELERDLATHAFTALADALLAMGAVLAKDHPRLATALLAPDSPDPDSLGQAFAYEAIVALHNSTGRPRHVTEVQALGVLSLYALTCDELWRSERSSELHEGSLADKEAQASIYCAAVSLNRVLFLISDYNITLKAYARSVRMDNFHALGDTETAAVSSHLNLSDTIIDGAFSPKDLSSVPDNPHVIAAKLFELAEWTYLARSGLRKATFDRAVQVYSQGLRWYETFFRYTSGCGETNTPFILFVHTFHHFGVLCLLTPHILESVPIARDGTRADAKALATIIYSELMDRRGCKTLDTFCTAVERMTQACARVLHHLFHIPTFTGSSVKAA